MLEAAVRPKEDAEEAGYKILTSYAAGRWQREPQAPIRPATAHIWKPEAPRAEPCLLYVLISVCLFLRTFHHILFDPFPQKFG